MDNRSIVNSKFKLMNQEELSKQNMMIMNYNRHIIKEQLPLKKEKTGRS